MGAPYEMAANLSVKLEFHLWFFKYPDFSMCLVGPSGSTGHFLTAPWLIRGTRQGELANANAVHFQVLRH